MALFHFPGAYVWERRLPNHEEIKARVLPKIIEICEKNQDNVDYKWTPDSESTVLTNFAYERLNPLSLFTMEEIEAITFESAVELANSGEYSGSFPSTFKLKTMWWNRYQAGSTAPPHVHSGTISGVYLMEQTEECPLRFHYTNPYAPNPDSFSMEHRAPAEEGSILLFPSTLLHWVVPAKGIRTTVSFNLNSAHV